MTKTTQTEAPLLALSTDIARIMGTKAGEASRQRDVARARFRRDHFRRWLTTQPAADKRALDDAYSAGYTEGYGGLYL